jgi:hypothetical protein
MQVLAVAHDTPSSAAVTSGVFAGRWIPHPPAGWRSASATRTPRRSTDEPTPTQSVTWTHETAARCPLGATAGGATSWRLHCGGRGRLRRDRTDRQGEGQYAGEHAGEGIRDARAMDHERHRGRAPAAPHPVAPPTVSGRVPRLLARYRPVRLAPSDPGGAPRARGSSWRDPMPSFAYTLVRWRSTVLALTNSACAIWVLLMPAAACVAVRSSVAVNASRPWIVAGARRRSEARRAPGPRRRRPRTARRDRALRRALVAPECGHSSDAGRQHFAVASHGSHSQPHARGLTRSAHAPSPRR